MHQHTGQPDALGYLQPSRDIAAILTAVVEESPLMRLLYQVDRLPGRTAGAKLTTNAGREFTVQETQNVDGDVCYSAYDANGDVMEFDMLGYEGRPEGCREFPSAAAVVLSLTGYVSGVRNGRAIRPQHQTRANDIANDIQRLVNDLIDTQRRSMTIANVLEISSRNHGCTCEIGIMPDEHGRAAAWLKTTNGITFVVREAKPSSGGDGYLVYRLLPDEQDGTKSAEIFAHTIWLATGYVCGADLATESTAA